MSRDKRGQATTLAEAVKQERKGMTGGQASRLLRFTWRCFRRQGRVRLSTCKVSSVVLAGRVKKEDPAGPGAPETMRRKTCSIAGMALAMAAAAAPVGQGGLVGYPVEAETVALSLFSRPRI